VSSRQRNYFARVAGTGFAEIPSSLSRAAERFFFQSQDWIGRNFFFSKPGCRDYFFRARTGSGEIPSSRSRAAEIIFSEPGLDREKFLLLEAGLQRFLARWYIFGSLVYFWPVVTADVSVRDRRAWGS
jgi:hypothetical protein